MSTSGHPVTLIPYVRFRKKRVAAMARKPLSMEGPFRPRETGHVEIYLRLFRRETASD